MCDMNQFVVVIPVTNETSVTRVDHFIQHVILKFDSYYLVILDDDIPFKSVFCSMYKILNINLGILTNKYKGIIVKKS